MFERFARRITGGYVALAIVLMVLVVGTSTALAFFLYVSGAREATAMAATRASEVVARDANLHLTPQQQAQRLMAVLQRFHFRVTAYDAQRHVLAQNQPAAPENGSRRAEGLIASIFGLPHTRVRFPGGVLIISPDLNRFGAVLGWYWEIMLPVGVLAALIAWLIGRRITARAVGPLRDVTVALSRIAAGENSPQPLLRTTGELQELTAAYNDVAQSLAVATQERNRSAAQLRQFVADAGHELRTPLTVVMGYIDVLRGGMVQGTAAVSDIYETMLGESRRMRDIIEKLIFLARLDRAEPSRSVSVFDANEAVSRAVASLTRLQPQERIVVHGDGSTALVRADESELEEAVKNVVDNALKYAPDSPVEIGVQARDGTVELRIADKGPGMSAVDAAHAFDRFYRGETRGDTEGSGLGLAIAKRAVERAGGSIALQSIPGEGTTLALRLPGADAAVVHSG